MMLPPYVVAHVGDSVLVLRALDGSPHRAPGPYDLSWADRNHPWRIVRISPLPNLSF